ncbi:MAG: hypothetical protein HY905_24010 [Deltaproteobacteria bacterium]|nr:hypothetical protein [Deltaproteobacteria bacterium]
MTGWQRNDGVRIATGGSTLRVVRAVFLALTATVASACLPGTEDAVPQIGSRLGLTTTVGRDGKPYNRLWYMSNSGDIYVQLGRYDAVNGWTAVPGAAAVVDRGDYGSPAVSTNGTPFGIATLSADVNILRRLEYGWFVGSDGTVYELRFASDLPFVRWRSGRLSGDEAAAGPVAGAMLDDGIGRRLLVGALEAAASRRLELAEETEWDHEDPDYALPPFMGVDGSEGLDPAAALAVANLSGLAGTSGEVMFFGRKADDGQLVVVARTATDRRVAMLGAPPGSRVSPAFDAVGEGSVANGLAHVVVVTDAYTAYYRGFKADLSGATDWIPLPRPPTGVLSRDRASVSVALGPGANPELLVSCLASDGHALRRYRAPAAAPWLGAWEVLPEIPREVSSLTGGVLTRYVAPDPTDGPPRGTTFVVGSAGLRERMRWVLLLDQPSPAPPAEPLVWKNLGFGHAKALRASGLSLPHSEVFYAEYDAADKDLQGRAVTAAIVRDNPFYITLSLSLDDGLSWVAEDLRLESTQLQLGARFQSDPTVAFGSSGTAFVLDVEGPLGAGVPIHECMTGRPPDDYGGPMAVRVYPVRLSGTEVVIDPPVTVAEPTGALWDHPWIAAVHHVAGPTSLYYAWVNGGGSPPPLWAAVGTEADPRPVPGSVLPVRNDAGQPLYWQPQLAVRADGRVLVLHGLHTGSTPAGWGPPRLCALLEAPAGGGWQCTDDVDLDTAVGRSAEHQDIPFAYRSPVWRDSGGLLDNAQAFAVAASPVDSDLVWYVFHGKNEDGQNCRDVYYSYSLDGGRSWTAAARLGPDEPAGQCSHQFDAWVAVTADGSAFVSWYDMGDTWASDLSSREVNRQIVRRGALIRRLRDGSYAEPEMLGTLGIVGDPENLPAHCSRGVAGQPVHFIGEYTATTGGHGHAHLVYPVAWWGEGTFTTQVLHDILTPWNY